MVLYGKRDRENTCHRIRDSERDARARRYDTILFVMSEYFAR